MGKLLLVGKIERETLTPPRPRIDASCRDWLKANGYEEIAKLIEKIESGWRKRKVKTRRDWWLVLAGTKDGKAKKVAGQTLPILRACRERQGYPPCEDEITKTPHEGLTSRPRAQKRWGAKWRRSMG